MVESIEVWRHTLESKGIRLSTKTWSQALQKKIFFFWGVTRKKKAEVNSVCIIRQPLAGNLSQAKMEDNSIDFSIGFKLNDITREEYHGETRWMRLKHNKNPFHPADNGMAILCTEGSLQSEKKFCEKIETSRRLLWVLLLEKFQQIWTLYKYCKHAK